MEIQNVSDAILFPQTLPQFAGVRTKRLSNKEKIWRWLALQPRFAALQFLQCKGC